MHNDQKLVQMQIHNGFEISLAAHFFVVSYGCTVALVLNTQHVIEGMKHLGSDSRPLRVMNCRTCTVMA